MLISHTKYILITSIALINFKHFICRAAHIPQTKVVYHPKT